MYVYFNPNKLARSVGDCAVRAVAKALNTDWDEAYAKMVVTGFRMGDLPSSDAVWGSVLRQNGFIKEVLPSSCPDCYTAEDFCRDHPSGTYVLGFGGHAATVVDGDLYDSWDSSNDIPQFYWRRV